MTDEAKELLARWDNAPLWNDAVKDADATLFDDTVALITTMQAEIERLKQAGNQLFAHSEHLLTCSWHDAGECNCGHDDAIKAWKDVAGG